MAVGPGLARGLLGGAWRGRLPAAPEVVATTAYPVVGSARVETAVEGKETERLQAEGMARLLHGLQLRRVSQTIQVADADYHRALGIHFVPTCGVRPLRLVILSKRAEPPSLILASRRSRRRRAARWAGDSSGVAITAESGKWNPEFRVQ